MASMEKKDFTEEKLEYVDSNAVGVEQVELGGRRLSTAEEVTELSGIEATAASKAAWLISVTVSRMRSNSEISGFC